jgi:Rrf2 family nitric oxide-sensitive transcriptional repressor
MLPKTAEYALRAVVWLARDPEHTAPAQQLAKHTKVPRRYLHAVLQELVRAKILYSQSGPGGGYGIVKSPCEITILDIVNAVAPVERIHRCPLGLRTHTRLCPLHKELDDVYAATEKAFRRVTIAQLVDSSSGILPLCEVKR